MLQDHAGDLPQRLKEATRALHARAERSGVMAALLARTIEPERYVALLANLHAIYAALEAGVERATPGKPTLAALARRSAIEADLRAFDRPVPTPAPATLDYVQRLHGLRGNHAHRLWAHVYVRCLGDLHGGQILGRLVRGLFALRGAEGTRFYDFGDDARVCELRALLRAQLGSLALSRVQADEVVAEAVWAFEAHCRIFEQIQASVLSRR